MDKIRITAVSYLNTKPLLYGLFKSDLSDRIDLQLNIPSVCAQKLQSGEADLALIPVAVLPELEQPRIVSNFCIGSEGAVRTVGLFAEKPLEELTEIFLDFHSRTSVELTRLLLEQYWKQSPTLIPASEGYERRIAGATGGLVIGDRVIGLENRFPYFYDLGEAWTAMTGLPFVFAAWVSNRALDPEFLEDFNAALALGLDHLPQLVYLLPSPAPGFDLQEYFTKNISYQLDSSKRKALRLFLSYLSPTLPSSLLHSLETVSAATSPPIL